MKRLWTIIATLCLTIFLAACNIQTVEEYESMQEQEQSIKKLTEQKPVQQSDEIWATPKPPEAEKEPEAEVVEEKVQEEQVTEKKAELAKAEVSREKKSEKKVVVTEQTQQKNLEKQPAVDKKSAEPKVEQPKRYVTIAIRIDSLLKHWDLLDASLQSEKYVPSSGAILKTTKYELLSEKDTVWDVLQRATKEHKIQIEYQGANENIYNSVYVEGINHLYEFSAGPLSGWMYKVNGVYPNYGCSQYKLADGDVIEWQYTVDLGRDLGHYWEGKS